MDKKYKVNFWTLKDTWDCLRIYAIKNNTTATEILNKLMDEFLKNKK